MTTQPEKTPEWRESQQWRRQGKTFTVEVYHYVEPGEPTYDDGRHRWNVYAYIYPGHPHFANFKGPDMWQDAATARSAGNLTTPRMGAGWGGTTTPSTSR